MIPFLDTGFLLTLLFSTDGSAIAWKLIRALDGPLPVPAMQQLIIENRLLRQIESSLPESDKKEAADALALFRYCVEEEVFVSAPTDYDAAFLLAGQWQRQHAGHTLPLFLFVWPALAATLSVTHFLSFDPRTRRLAKAAGMQVMPATL